MKLFDWLGKSKMPPLLSVMQRYWLGNAFFLMCIALAASSNKVFPQMPLWLYVFLLSCSFFLPAVLFQRVIGEFNWGQNVLETTSGWSKGRMIRSAFIGGCYGYYLFPWGNLNAVWQILTTILLTGWIFESTIGHKFPVSADDPTEGNFPFGVNK